MNPVAIGRRIKSLRRQKGLSQEQLAKGICTAAYISHLEAGKRKASERVLQQIAPRLGLSPFELTHGRCKTCGEWAPVCKCVVPCPTCEGHGEIPKLLADLLA